MNLEEQLTAEQFYNNFVADDRFVKYILGGLKTTLLVTLFAVLLGIFLGSLWGPCAPPMKGQGSWGLKRVLPRLSFCDPRNAGDSPADDHILPYFFVSGLLQAALRDPGLWNQLRSLCGGDIPVRHHVHRQWTVRGGKKPGLQLRPDHLVYYPAQAFKNVLPALCNEFIALLKETSVSGFIALQDLTRGADIIRSRTYNVVLPLFTVALVYWMIVTFLTYMVGKLETRLRKNEKR